MLQSSNTVSFQSGKGKADVNVPLPSCKPAFVGMPRGDGVCSTGIVMKFGSDRIISGMFGSDELYGTLSMEEPAPSIDKS